MGRASSKPYPIVRYLFDWTHLAFWVQLEGWQVSCCDYSVKSPGVQPALVRMPESEKGFSDRQEEDIVARGVSSFFDLCCQYPGGRCRQFRRAAHHVYSQCLANSR